MVEGRDEDLGMLARCINTIGASETGLPRSPDATNTLPLPYQAKVLVSVGEISGGHILMYL